MRVCAHASLRARVRGSLARACVRSSLSATCVHRACPSWSVQAGSSIGAFLDDLLTGALQRHAETNS
jgi:hypothetical protein